MIALDLQRPALCLFQLARPLPSPFARFVRVALGRLETGVFFELVTKKSSPVVFLDPPVVAEALMSLGTACIIVAHPPACSINLEANVHCFKLKICPPHHASQCSRKAGIWNCNQTMRKQ